MCTKHQAIELLAEAAKACRAIYGEDLKEAYLYGSYARGDYHAESDVDILLIVDRSAEDMASLRRELAAVASRLSLEHDITVSITAKPLDLFMRFQTTLPFYKNVVKEGIRYAG